MSNWARYYFPLQNARILAMQMMIVVTMNTSTMMAMAVMRMIYFFILKPPPGLLQWCLHNNKDAIKSPRSATSLTLAIVDFVVLMNTFLQSTIALAVATRIKL